MVASEGLAFKAYEIEELADVYFFRPLGWVVASAARAAHLTPNAVSVLAGIIGAAGGAMLVRPSLGLVAFAALILHGIFDSADGQLARMTGRSSALGRLLDGLAGYVTYIAILIALPLGLVWRGAGPMVWLWTVLTGLTVALHALMYDYYRNAYIAAAITGAAGEDPKAERTPVDSALMGFYDSIQRALVGRHPDVERALASRAVDGRISEADRARYRESFYWHVRGWNLLGDNTRFYAIGVLAFAGRLDLFFAFILLPMNAALVCLRLWQARTDNRFLSRL